jgi:hypothetical protein
VIQAMPWDSTSVAYNGIYNMLLLAILRSFRTPHEMTWYGFFRYRYTFTCVVALDLFTGACTR